MASAPQQHQPQPQQQSGVLGQYHAQITQHLDAYYTQTKLLAVLQIYVRDLTQRFTTSRLVPINPFTALLSHTRQAEISADTLLGNDSSHDLLQQLLLFRPPDGRSVPTPMEITTFKTATPPALCVWGPRDALQRVQYSTAWQQRVEELYEILVAWLRDSEVGDEGCRVQSIGAIVGPGVPFSDMLPLFPTVEVERHVVVHSDQLELAMAVFARHQIRTLFEVSKKGISTSTGSPLVVIGPCCLEIHHSNNDSQWTFDTISASRQSFISAVKLALVAGGAFMIDVVLVRPSNGEGKTISQLLRCQVSFIFHFHHSPSTSTTSPPVPSKATATAMEPRSRSFVASSQFLQSGVCVTSAGAFDLSCRFHEETTRQQPLPSSSAPQQSTAQPLGDLVCRLEKHSPTSVATRQWLILLRSTVAFRLTRLVELVDNLLFVLQFIDANDATAVETAGQLLAPYLHEYTRQIDELVHDASVGRSSSLLSGLQLVISELCSLPHQSESPEKMYARLLHSRDAIAWLASATGRDIVALAARGTTTMVPSGMADLRPDIARAIEQRRFPAAIVAESVFAQYLVDTELDVAIERAVVNTVVDGLPPNPFVALSGHLRATASSFFAQSKYHANSRRLNDVERMEAIGFTTVVAPQRKTLAAANGQLLRLLDTTRLCGLHDEMIKWQVYRSTSYYPSKASYSASLSTCLILDDPSFTLAEIPAQELLMQRAEVVEHVVIEGEEWSQALWFFVDAVRRDAARLQQLYQDTDIHILDRNGDAATSVPLEDMQVFEELMMDDTPKCCVLRVAIAPRIRLDGEVTAPLVQIITKSYVFYHVPTQTQASLSTCLSDVYHSKLMLFGVWTDAAAAKATLSMIVRSRERSQAVDGKKVAQYGEQAERRNGRFLLRHLKRLSAAEGCEPALPSQAAAQSTCLVHLSDLESALQWLHKRLSSTLQDDGTPRNEDFTHALATIFKAIAANLERHAVPLAEALGYIDAPSLATGAKALGALPGNDEAAAQPLVRRLWIAAMLLRSAAGSDVHSV